MTDLDMKGPEVLSPCPFCGEADLLVVNAYGIEGRGETPEDRSHEVVCDKCGSSGSEIAPRLEAIERWNRRATPTNGDDLVEPELTCPHIDAFIAATKPPADVLGELDAIRNINSQLRYGLWFHKANAQEAAARILALTAERDDLMSDLHTTALQWNALDNAVREIAAHEPNENHNHNLNDLIACAAVKTARKALEPSHE